MHIQENSKSQSMTIKVYLDVYITITMEKVFPVWHVMPECFLFLDMNYIYIPCFVIYMHISVHVNDIS